MQKPNENLTKEEIKEKVAELEEYISSASCEECIKKYQQLQELLKQT